jgi:hypothetical protein
MAEVSLFGPRRRTEYRPQETVITAEHRRLMESESRAADWKNWGPYGACRVYLRQGTSARLVVA